MFGRRRSSRSDSLRDTPLGQRRIDVPIYLDAGVALSLSASLSRGVAVERSVQTAITKEAKRAVKWRAGTGAISAGATADATDKSAVTESEVRMQTEESIFNGVRTALSQARLISSPAGAWADTEWQVGQFVEIRPARIVVPLISVFARLRALVEAFVMATSELSTEALTTRVPQLLHIVQEESDESDNLESVLSMVTELGEVAQALARVLCQLEDEAESSGLVDIVMFERQLGEPSAIAVASLDREYVDTKLLRRLGQGNFGVLGKVLRVPEAGTAFNAYRNSMLGATNQLPVLLNRLTEQLYQLPRILGDSVLVGDEENHVRFDFVGSASAISELHPLWLLPSLEVLPVAIYA